MTLFTRERRSPTGVRCDTQGLLGCHAGAAQTAAMIELLHVTKRYGDTLAVDDLSFTVQPGVVTGFLGPNGAGKSTTMRMIVGLDAPNAGEIRLDGRAYRDLAGPLHEVGALLEARAVHGGRSAHDHLLAMAQTHGIDRARVSEVIGLVGLADVAGKRVGTFSLGMCQRLGIASALLGDPGIVILDEPTNGLDPEGIVWIRGLLRDLAAEGRTVFLSSHLMSEMALTADHLVIVGRGRLIAQTTVEDVVRQASTGPAYASARQTVRCSRPSSLWPARTSGYARSSATCSTSPARRAARSVRRPRGAGSCCTS